MFTIGDLRRRLEPSASVASAVSALFVDEHHHDRPGLAIPTQGPQLVVRFGPSTPGGLDAHVMGVRKTVRRKFLRGGQRAVTARLRLGAHEAVLGAPASAFAGAIVALEDVWGDAAARRLFDRLGEARDLPTAAAVLESAIAERLGTARRSLERGQLAADAARRLRGATVSAVAADLHMSERQLRRLFQDTVGVSPKTFARLARFRRALRAAREGDRDDWAGIAVEAGYYDQAHLIAEFRAISGVTPRALLAELRQGPSLAQCAVEAR